MLYKFTFVDKQLLADGVTFEQVHAQAARKRNFDWLGLGDHLARAGGVMIHFNKTAAHGGKKFLRGLRIDVLEEYIDISRKKGDVIIDLTNPVVERMVMGGPHFLMGLKAA